MPSEVLQAVERFRRDLLARDADALSEMAQRWIQIEHRLEVYAQALTEELVRTGAAPTAYQLSRMRRYQELMRQTVSELAKYEEYAGDFIRRRMESEAFNALDEYQSLINASLVDSGAVNASFDRMSTEAVERIVGAATGSPLQDVLDNASSLGADAMTRELATGIALGHNPNEIARTMIRSGLGTSFRRFATIARTEVLRAHRQTILEGFRKSEVVTGYRRVAAKSMRTCLACLVLDGTIYPLEEDFAAHPNCRCQLVPVIAGRTPLVYETGMEWLDGLSEEKQRAIMGRDVHKLWKKGLLTKDELVKIHVDPVWGPSPRALSMKEIRAPKVVPSVQVTPPPVTTGVSGWPDELKYRPIQGFEDVDNLFKDLPRSAERFQVADRVKEILDHPDAVVTSRVWSHDLEAIVESGRLKSQFETGTSSGSFDPRLRAYAENFGLGYPTNVKATERPIYGFVESPLFKQPRDQASSYGNMQLIFKKDVIPRSTVTFGDSLDGFAEDRTIGVPFKNFSHHGLVESSLSSLTGRYPDYIEAQIQGGVTLADIERIRVPAEFIHDSSFMTSDMQRARPALDRLRRLGIIIEEFPEDD